jgi:hypothetical protein
MEDYIFTIVEFDADDVDNSSHINHGRKEHWINLGQKTYEVRRIGDGIQTQITQMVWDDNLVLIQSYIDREAERMNILLLLNKTRQYELINFGFSIPVGPNDIQDATDQIAATQATVNYLKNYKLP